MKKVITVMALLICGATATFAQTAATPTTAPVPQHNPPTPEEKAQRFNQRLTSRLQLTPEQSKQTMDAQLAFEKKVEALRQTKSGSREQYMSLMNDRDAEFKKVLSADQYTKFSTEMKPQMAQRQGQGAPMQHQQTAPVQK